MRPGGGGLLRATDLLPQFAQFILVTRMPELDEEILFLVLNVTGDLCFELRDELVEVDGVRPTPLQFLQQLFDTGMVGDLLVGERISSGQETADGRMEMLFLGD